LDLFDESTDFSVVQDPLNRFASLAQTDRSLADITMQLAQLLVELADFEPDSQQFRFFQRTDRRLRRAMAQRRQSRFQVMFQPLE
jgi:hypothetical protein